MRLKDTWDDSSAIEPDVLCQEARKSGSKLHIAEAMTIADIKNFEMPIEKHVHKGRVVYRGDAVRDERGAPAIFQALHSLPTNVQAINLTLFVGMLSGFLVLGTSCGRVPSLSAGAVEDDGPHLSRATT